MAPKKCLLAWSSGKDSAWALHALRRADVPVVGLLTTINQAFDRVAMHAVRRSLLDAQARSIGIPLWPVPLPWPCSNQDYERIMGDVCRQAKTQGIERMAFGDLYLPDVRAYRERQLQGSGLTPLFPLWRLPTDALAREMLAGGLQARITCVDPKVLPPAFAGREFDQALLADLPAGVDPCGEKGEFHTFAYGGPMFREPIPISTGEVVERDGFVFADLLLNEEARP
ncbi:MAG TPA: ATP-binding protein [Candidatus Methylomirabilis sp.]